MLCPVHNGEQNQITYVPHRYDYPHLEPHTYIHTRLLTYIHIYILTNWHTYIHTYILTYWHTWYIHTHNSIVKPNQEPYTTCHLDTFKKQGTNVFPIVRRDVKKFRRSSNWNLKWPDLVLTVRVPEWVLWRLWQFAAAGDWWSCGIKLKPQKTIKLSEFLILQLWLVKSW